MTYSAYSYCNDTVLIHKNDTTYSVIDTLDYYLNRDTMRFLFEPETMSLSKAVVLQYSQLIRKGSGNGFVGVWTNLSYGYTVVSGVLTKSEQQNFESFNQYLTYGVIYEYEFTPTQYFFYASGEFDYATAFMINWNSAYYFGDTMSYPSDSARYDITVNRISNYKLTLTGNKTNEVVTLLWDVFSGSGSSYNKKYTETFTSSNPEHTTFTYYSDPVNCPNNSVPSWYNSFCMENARTTISSLEKRAIHPDRSTRPARSVMDVFQKPSKLN